MELQHRLQSFDFADVNLHGHLKAICLFVTLCMALRIIW